MYLSLKSSACDGRACCVYKYIYMYVSLGIVTQGRPLAKWNEKGSGKKNGEGT